MTGENGKQWEMTRFGVGGPSISESRAYMFYLCTGESVATDVVVFSTGSSSIREVSFTIPTTSLFVEDLVVLWLFKPLLLW